MSAKFKPVIVLGIICAVAAVLLAYMNSVTAPAIAEYEKASANIALEEVSCSMEIGDSVEVSDDQYVKSYNKLFKDGSHSGYVLMLSSSGYGGPLSVAASYSVDGVVMGAKLVSDSETPGVGKKAENEGYMDKFVGTGSSLNPVPTSKDMLSEADAASVSGASMTFTGISKALDAGSNFVKGLGGK